MQTESSESADDPRHTYRDRGWLHEQYIENERSTVEIADDLGITAPTVSRWLARHDIEARGRGEAQTPGNTKPLQNSTWLKKQFIECERVQEDIANQLGVSQPTVSTWLAKHGIATESLEPCE